MSWTDADGRPLRHARVWVDAGSPRCVEVDGRSADALDAWIAAGRAVVARRHAPDAGDAWCLAVALPSSQRRSRIAFTVLPRAVLRIARPLRLDEVVDYAPSGWRSALLDLLARSRQAEVTLMVYGSLAWQAIAGETCVTSTSDVDLLWTASSLEHVDRVLSMLMDWEATSGLRADGELLLPDGGGVAWRELASRPARVLVKHQDHVSLQRWPGRCFADHSVAEAT